MANAQKRLPNNIAGDFFVDSTCINCDTCRQLAPTVFADDGEYSYVQQQPQSSQEEREALRALLACPTSSIGSVGKQKARLAMEDFPFKLEDNVYYLGFHAESSFGASSYFIEHPQGNWMIDSPRYVPFLAKKLEAMGGLQYIFLTHRDDTADANRYAAQFGSTRIIHQRDQKAIPNAEYLIKGEESVAFKEDFLIIPTPGHTQGHCVLLYKNKFLFSGDHLWWSRHSQHLDASKRYNWHSWKKQIQSMEKLLDHSFTWVLPGHGRRIQMSRQTIHQQLTELIAEMKQR